MMMLKMLTRVNAREGAKLVPRVLALEQTLEQAKCKHWRGFWGFLYMSVSLFSNIYTGGKETFINTLWFCQQSFINEALGKCSKPCSAGTGANEAPNPMMYIGFLASRFLEQARNTRNKVRNNAWS